MSLLVAEIKPVDPFTGWRSRLGPIVLREIAIREGDIVGVHTHRAWGGSLAEVREVGRRTDKPILAKGAHMFGFEVEAAVEAGATYVLTLSPKIAKAYPDVCWFEGNWSLGRDVPVVCNKRNLINGKLTEHFFVPMMSPGTRLVQASGIQSPNDVELWAWAHLVGTHLPEYVNCIK